MSHPGYDSILSYPPPLSPPRNEQEPLISSPNQNPNINHTNDEELQHINNNNDDDLSESTTSSQIHHQREHQQNNHHPSTQQPGIFQQLIAECIGTCILVQIGCAGYCVAMYVNTTTTTTNNNNYNEIINDEAHSSFSMNSLSSQWSIALFWFIGAVLATSCTYSVSGGHCNPAISLAVGLIRCDKFNILKVIPYWIAQISGATIGAFINLTIFESLILQYESIHDIVRGTNQSLKSCNLSFGDYYMLSPVYKEDGVSTTTSSNRSSYSTDGMMLSSWSHAIFVEAFGTALLVVVYFAITNERNYLNKKGGLLVSFVIGLTYAVIIVMLGSFTGAAVNPARDLGPRLITYYYGWGPVSLQGYDVYIIGPFLGAPIGAIIADGILY